MTPLEQLNQLKSWQWIRRWQLKKAVRAELANQPALLQAWLPQLEQSFSSAEIGELVPYDEVPSGAISRMVYHHQQSQGKLNAMSSFRKLFNRKEQASHQQALNAFFNRMTAGLSNPNTSSQDELLFAAGLNQYAIADIMRVLQAGKTESPVYCAIRKMKVNGLQNLQQALHLVETPLVEQLYHFVLTPNALADENITRLFKDQKLVNRLFRQIMRDLKHTGNDAAKLAKICFALRFFRAEDIANALDAIANASARPLRVLNELSKLDQRCMPPDVAAVIRNKMEKTQAEMIAAVQAGDARAVLKLSDAEFLLEPAVQELERRIQIELTANETCQLLDVLNLFDRSVIQRVLSANQFAGYRSLVSQVNAHLNFTVYNRVAGVIHELEKSLANQLYESANPHLAWVLDDEIPFNRFVQRVMRVLNDPDCNDEALIAACRALGFLSALDVSQVFSHIEIDSRPCSRLLGRLSTLTRTHIPVHVVAVINSKLLVAEQKMVTAIERCHVSAVKDLLQANIGNRPSVIKALQQQVQALGGRMLTQFISLLDQFNIRVIHGVLAANHYAGYRKLVSGFHDDELRRRARRVNNVCDHISEQTKSELLQSIRTNNHADIHYKLSHGLALGFKVMLNASSHPETTKLLLDHLSKTVELKLLMRCMLNKNDVENIDFLFQQMSPTTNQIYEWLFQAHAANACQAVLAYLLTRLTTKDIFRLIRALNDEGTDHATELLLQVLTFMANRPEVNRDALLQCLNCVNERTISDFLLTINLPLFIDIANAANGLHANVKNALRCVTGVVVEKHCTNQEEAEALLNNIPLDCIGATTSLRKFPIAYSKKALTFATKLDRQRAVFERPSLDCYGNQHLLVNCLKELDSNAPKNWEWIHDRMTPEVDVTWKDKINDCIFVTKESKNPKNSIFTRIRSGLRNESLRTAAECVAPMPVPPTKKKPWLRVRFADEDIDKSTKSQSTRLK